jgi:hypothetical protein
LLFARGTLASVMRGEGDAQVARTREPTLAERQTD